jgi:putative transposase
MEYLESGEIPEIGKRMGRPRRVMDPEEVNMVKEAYAKYRVSATTLERLIRRDYGVHIPHNWIHKILLKEGYAKPKSKKDIRKKSWIRYQRRHSLTAVHIDWHQRPNDGIWVLKVEDDASRALLAMQECECATTEASILGMQEALQYGQIKQCISDHGSQFISNIGGDSRFKEFLDANGIRQILCRIKHPQSNGKVEKMFDLYEQHRDAFKSKEEYMYWYNYIRPHRSLDFSNLETPWEAFERKRREN